MSDKLKRIIDRLPIYELCNYCDYCINGDCRAECVVCKEKLYRQIEREIKGELCFRYSARWMGLDKADGGRKMIEDKYMVTCNNETVAENCSIETALIIVKGYFEKFFMEPDMVMAVTKQRSENDK